jgi:hypothetical protein
VGIVKKIGLARKWYGKEMQGNGAKELRCEVAKEIDEQECGDL